MNVFEIIKQVATMLNVDEVKDLESTENLDERTTTLLGIFMYCFNEVYQELCSDYFPIVVEEEVNLDNNCLVYNTLNHNINRIYAIFDNFGNSLKFQSLARFAKIEGEHRSVIVRYSYNPTTITDVQTNIECSELGLNERIIVLGIATEYCLYRGKLTEATMYDKKYKNAIECAKIPTKRMYLKSRRWM